MNKTDQPIIVLSGNVSFREYMGSLYRHKALVRTFVVREIKAKYAQTYLGILWSVIQALVGLGIITFFFGYLLKIDTGTVPYPVFAFPGMIAWYLFSFIIGYSGSSLIQSRHLVQKLHFPKIILPVAYALVGLVDFIIWTILLILLMVVLKQPFTFNILALPVFMLLNLLAGLSISIWLSALTVRFRDLLIIIPYIIGFGIFVTPVFFPGTMVPESFSWALYLNPMAGIISGLRWCFLNTAPPSLYYLTGLLPVMVLLFSGLDYFRRKESRMADDL
jgi:lipopolysaccharide transport system permease protein